MPVPWFKPKPKRNTDGGPPTALFSFDRDRERQMAEHYSGARPEWVEARYRLIDEVLAYRRTGRFSQAFLDACDAEFAVASWTSSEGVRRLVELGRDGHPEAAERLENLMSSRDWRVRYEALLTSFLHTPDATARRALLRRALADRSARIRTRLAGDAAFAHLIDLANEIEAAAMREANEKDARSIFWAVWYMRLNDRTGNRSSLGGSEEDRREYEADWSRFRAGWAFGSGK